MKKTTLFLIFALVGTILNAQNLNIPDTNFRAYLLSSQPSPWIDTNGDGIIQVGEAQAYTGVINVNNKNISDLTGIEAFTSVTELSFAYNNVSSIDLSQNVALTYLSCGQNSLTSLDLSQNTSLVTIHCHRNAITSLDLSQNTALTTLACYNNQLTALNLANGNNSNMNYMVASNNSLTCIQHDAGGFTPPAWTGAPSYTGWAKDGTASWSTNCNYPCMNIVNIPDVNFKNALLAHGSTITGAGISTIDTDGDGEICVSEAQAYTGTINVNNKNISDLTGIEAFTAITKLYCTHNTLPSFDISQNTSLTELVCKFNALTNLDISQNTALIELDCRNNNLTSLNVSQNIALTEIFCHYNIIDSIDVSQNSSLINFYCRNNQLTGLNVANGNNANMLTDAVNNPNLNCIQHDANFNPATNSNWHKDANASWSNDCSASSCVNIVSIPNTNFKNALLAHGSTITGSGISTIDTDGDGEICDTEAQAYTGTINVNNKNISDLTGIEAFTNLAILDCGNNQLTSIDVSLNVNLAQLVCYSNEITSLDISQNTALTHLTCSNNELTNLNVSNNPNLSVLLCYQNQISSLNVSNNTYLTYVNCAQNQIDGLDLSNSANLNTLNCSHNQLTYLNVANTNNTNLLYLIANNNPNLTCIQHDTGFDPSNNSNWQKDATTSWSDDCAILATSLSIQGQNGVNSISTNGGTLQMEANILPTNASNTSVTWSVINGTGSAIIDTNGLLTATANGAVLVKAITNDGSNLSDSVEITISNQGVGIHDVAFNNLYIYPNPVKDIVTIDVQENLEAIQLIDLRGKVVKTFDAKDRNLDVSNIEKGIYLLEIVNSNKKSVVKIYKL